MGLIQLGVRRGDRVAILSENRYEWLITDHAILSTGAADVTLHAPLSAKQVEFQLRDSGARGIFVSNQEQADKVFAVENQLPDLEFLVHYDDINCEHSRLNCLSFSAVKHRAMIQSGGRIDDVLQTESALQLDDLATIIYTSGTTGNPKGVMLSHGNLLSNAQGLHELSPYRMNQTLFSWLPYSHVYARTVDHYLTSVTGMILALAESLDTVTDNLKIIHPTWFTAVPRFYEKVWGLVESLDPATRRSVLHGIFGQNIVQLTSGGAPLPRHICEGYFSADLPLLEGYGLTESSPVICFNHINSYRIGTVGKSLSAVEVKISDDGEILTRGPHVMQGYWNNSEATAATMEGDWLKTGDVGELDADGFLTITDRKKDLIVTSSGKNVAPSIVERALTADPFIEQAVVYGDGRQFISALLVPNADVLKPWAQDNSVELETTDDFLDSKPLHDMFAERVKTAMEQFSSPERVKQFLILARPFELEAEELTATLKVRRRHIIQKYESELAALYE